MRSESSKRSGKSINNPHLLEGGSQVQSCVPSSSTELVTGRAGPLNLLQRGKSMRRDTGGHFQPTGSEEVGL